MSLPGFLRGTWRQDRRLVVLAVFVALWIGLSLPALLYPDLNLDYPFVDGDSHDWIANGLKLAGEDVRHSGRSPLLPALVAGLDAVGLLAGLPVLLLLLFAGTLLAFYRTAAELTSPPAAFAVSLALLFGHALTGLSRQLMADVPASCLLFLALREGLAAGRDPRRHVSAGVLAALSALTQKAALLWPLPVAVTALAADRRALRSRWFWLGALAYVLPQAAWVVLEKSLFEPQAAGHWRFLSPHGDGVPFYLWSAAALLGWPAGLLLVRGTAAAARGGLDRSWISILSLFVTLAGFFVFLYDYNALRLLVYALWPAALLVARGLASLPRRFFGSGLAGCLLVAVAALPTPDEGQQGAWVPLWPAPPLLLEAGLLPAGNGGSPRLDTSRLEALTPSVGEIAGWSQPARLRAARRASPPRIGARHWPGEGRVFFLYDRPQDGGGRYRVYTRLGNAVFRRVQFVPEAAFLRHRPLLGGEKVGRIDDGLHAWRVWVAGLPGHSLVVTPSEDSWLASLPRRPEARGDAAAVGRAQAIRRLVEASRFVGIFPALARGEEPDTAELYLLFLLDRPDLYVFTGEDRAGALAGLAGSPVLSRQLLGNVEVRKTEVLDQPAALVGFGGLGDV